MRTDPAKKQRAGLRLVRLPIGRMALGQQPDLVVDVGAFAAHEIFDRVAQAGMADPVPARDGARSCRASCLASA